MAVLQGTKLYQRTSADSIVSIFIQEAPSQHFILLCIHQPFLWPPSLSHTLYPHLSLYSNIFLPISPAYISIPLKTYPPHTYCDRFYFGVSPYTIICYMVLPFYIVNASEHPLLSTYPVFLSLSQRPNLISIHR